MLLDPLSSLVSKFAIHRNCSGDLSLWREGRIEGVLQLCDKPVKYSKNPKILGIEFDPQCSFTKQAETSAKSLRERLQILQCLEGKSWGPRASDFRRIYVRPGGLYGIGTWGSFLTDTSLSKLESCNSRASCIITGLPAGTNAVYSRVEADLPTTKQVIEEAAKTFSKYSEMSRNSHLRDLTLPPPRNRLKSRGATQFRQDWWSAGSGYCTKIEILDPSEIKDKIQRERDKITTNIEKKILTTIGSAEECHLHTAPHLADLNK